MSQTGWIGAAPDGGGLRLWALGPEGAVLHEGRATALSAAEIDGFAGAALPVVAAGQGRTPRPLPCPPLEDVPPLDQLGDSLRLAAIAPLVQTRDGAETAGEETAIAGFLDLNPGFDGVLCLPGPVQTLWVHVSAAEVVSLQPFATPRLAAALGGGDAEPDFETAVSDTLSRPERLAAHLADPRRGGAWGALIGAELAAAKPYWLGQPVAVIGSGEGGRHYIAALTAQGLAPLQADADAMLLKGLAVARRRAGL